MKISRADVLSRHLKPLCPRDNHQMKYRAGRSTSNAEDQPSFHCGFEGCSVRYNANDGYYMLIGMPDHANTVDEPGVNTLKCPRHDTWLYRRLKIDSIAGVLWCCGVEGCDYSYDANTKVDWGQDLE